MLNKPVQRDRCNRRQSTSSRHDLVQILPGCPLSTLNTKINPMQQQNKETKQAYEAITTSN